MRAKRVPAQEKRCQMRREDGLQCRAARLRDAEYCFFHHPWVREKRAEAERIEGLPLREGSGIHELLVEAIRGVESGRLNAQQAYALGWLVRLLRENLPEVEKERERHESEARVGEEAEPEFGAEEGEGGLAEGEEKGS